MTRASGRVSIVIMILLMLVQSKERLVISQIFNLSCENSVDHNQALNCLQGSLNDIFYFFDLIPLALNCFFMLDKGFKRLDDAVCVCHSVSVWV